MGMFLNSRTPYEAYRRAALAKYFVDKSELLAELIPALGMPERFFCITRPRRFGKSIMANMVGAFFGKAAEANEVFEKLKIASKEVSRKLNDAGCGDYKNYLNQYHVVYIDFSVEPRDCNSYRQYIDRIQDGLNRDLAEAYPEYGIDSSCASWDILAAIFQKTGDKFIFVIDEWDALFQLSYVTEEEKQSYLRFLRSLLKGQVYVELAYMTGILPIAKYSDGSEINMFLEYNMATSERFSEYFGFLASEVDEIFAVYQKTVRNVKISREDLTGWYDGYHTAAGGRIYNPRSIVCALTDNQLRNYWTSSGTYDSIFGYIKDNVDDMQEDLALLFAGEAISADIQEYAATSMQLSTKDEIYSAMVVYGLLTYDDGCVSIPNRELMESYAAMILELKVDSTPEAAIQQIKDKKYSFRFSGKIGEKPKYTGRILAVGISYGKKTKEHVCKVEEL
ncbi:MAG: AAA family ATPase [Bacilli bacterium]|jgi:hypothetical protein|nr:AAA family ATPase [Bacilli bacterium]